MMNLERHEEVSRYKIHKDSFNYLLHSQLTSAMQNAFTQYCLTSRCYVAALVHATVIDAYHCKQHIGKNYFYVESVLNFGSNKVFVADTITIKADEIEGKYFKYFLNRLTNEIISYDSICKIEVFGNICVEAIYSDKPDAPIKKDIFSIVSTQFNWILQMKKYMFVHSLMTNFIGADSYNIQCIFSLNSDIEEPTLEDVNDVNIKVWNVGTGVSTTCTVAEHWLVDKAAFRFRFVATVQRKGKQEIIYTKTQNYKLTD